MDWLINWLREERDALMKAKGVFCLVLLLGIGVGYWAADTLYSHEVSGSHDDAKLWQDRWQQLWDSVKNPPAISQAPTSQAPPPASVPAPVAKPLPTPATKPTAPPQKQAEQSPGTINNGSIVTSHQSGGQNTVNNFSPPDRTINVTNFAADLRIFGSQHVIVESILGDSEGYKLAQQVSVALKQAGWTVDDGGIRQGVFSGPMPGILVSVGPTAERHAGVPVSADSLPPVAVALATVFKKYGFRVGLNLDSSITDPNAVSLIIGNRPA